MSTLGYAILGLLATRPQTGYEVARRMKTPIGYMWTAQHSQIYPELARLESAGLVKSAVIPGRGPRDTKRYRITAAGREELAAWVDSPLTEVARSEMLLRVWSLWLVSPERAIAFATRQRQRYADLLDSYAREETEFPVDDLISGANPEFFAYATLRHGIGRVRAALDWWDWLLEQLRTRLPDGSMADEVIDRAGGAH